ncbi:DNA ligase [Sulfurimonas sp. NW15]|uniref:DNA ligase n=1 Tax=Sulfurimonas sp. NW15 TaxID=2922729 RepID=UPI003DA8AF27
MKLYLILLLPFVLFAQKPQLLLLQVYKDQNITNWVMSEKLDGIRAYWDGKQLISRGGKHIYAPKFFIKDFPPFELDGELWSKRDDFENISSIVRDKVPSEKWKEITYNIFEVPHAKEGLLKRLEKVKPYESDILHVIVQREVNSKDELFRFLSVVESKGGEGVVVRDPNVAYIDKRTSKALKLKSFKDAECRVVSFNHGKGKLANMMGSLTCRLDNNATFKIGSGFTNKERMDPPKVGDIVTFKYQEFTKYKKPRFPVFLRVRYKGSDL